MSTETYTHLVPTPNRRSMNSGLSAAKVSTLKSIFGAFPDLPENCGENRNPKIRALLETRNVGPFRVTGIRPALDSLERIFAAVKRDHPDLYKIVGTAGMHCYRRVRGASTPSNHCAGTAIDLTVNGVLPPMDFSPESPELIPNGFLVLYSYFHREGWFWAAGYAGGHVDAMHFEAADETLWRWYHDGFQTPAPKPVPAPRLFINNKLVREAYLVKDRNGLSWYAPQGSLSEVLGIATQTPSLIAPVGAYLERNGWKVEKYSPRLATMNRADIRAVRA